jgi:FkbM family methyltransferase
MPNLTRLAATAQLRLLRALLRRLSPGDRAYMARMASQDRFDPATAAFVDLCEKSVLGWKNKQYAVELNGEEALLARLKPFAPKVLLDVGANVGEWALAAHRQVPEAQVHCFEIAPPTAARLARAMAEAGANAVVNDFGLGAEEGSVTLYFTPDYTLGASTVRGAMEITAREQGIADIQEVAARITTGDAYLERNNIDHVDFLKIDVEGAEPQVLAGFSASLARGAIDLVQFEYGPLNLSSRWLLADAYEFFRAHGYWLGKLYPEGIAFKSYDHADEDFIGPNYVACRELRVDLISALHCPVPRLPA